MSSVIENFSLDPIVDRDILEVLNSQRNKSNFIRDALREKINKKSSLIDIETNIEKMLIMLQYLTNAKIDT